MDFSHYTVYSKHGMLHGMVGVDKQLQLWHVSTLEYFAIGIHLKLKLKLLWKGVSNMHFLTAVFSFLSHSILCVVRSYVE